MNINDNRHSMLGFRYTASYLYRPYKGVPLPLLGQSHKERSITKKYISNAENFN